MQPEGVPCPAQFPEPPSALPQMLDVWQTSLGWQPSTTQHQQFQRLYEEILAGNQHLNLTRITAPEEFWEKHLWDSLSGIKPWLGEGQEPFPESSSSQVIDIGTGAGFPGIPVAIAHPAWQLTLLDSTRKKLVFLNTLLQTVGIPNARTQVERVEQLGQHPQHREGYDLALIRAVATASVCAEYALPLLKLGGVAVLYRGQWTEEEAAGLTGAIAHLGGTLEQVESFTTPLTYSIRHCLYLRKVTPTDLQFPRAVGIPTQKPLG